MSAGFPHADILWRFSILTGIVLPILGHFYGFGRQIWDWCQIFIFASFDQIWHINRGEGSVSAGVIYSAYSASRSISASTFT